MSRNKIASGRQYYGRLCCFGLCFGLAITTLSYLLLAIYFYSVAPNPQTSYLASLSQLQQNRDDADKAWPIYRRAIKPKKIELDAFCNKHINATPNDGEKWTLAKVELAKLETLLDEIRAGSKLPILGLDFAPLNRYHTEDHSTLILESNFPRVIPAEISRNLSNRLAHSAEQNFSYFPSKHLYLLKELVSLLRIDMHYAIEISDFERAVSNVEASFGLSHQSANMRHHVESAVSIKLWSMSLSSLIVLVEDLRSGLTEEQLSRLLRALERTDLFGQFEPWNDIIQNQSRMDQYYTNNGKNDGHLTNDWYLLMSVATSGHFDIPHSDQNIDLSRWSIFARPLVVLFGPSRRDVASVLDLHESLLREAWKAPYDRQAIAVAIESIRHAELPNGFERDFTKYLQHHDEIVSLNLRRNEVSARLRSLLEEYPLNNLDSED